jgi:hypothetical protein
MHGINYVSLISVSSRHLHIYSEEPKIRLPLFLRSSDKNPSYIRANTEFGLYNKATNISPLLQCEVSLPFVYTSQYRSVRVLRV